MPVWWIGKSVDGYSEHAITYTEETAPSIIPGTPKHAKQTWFITNLQPDGICINCRSRPGFMEQQSGCYTCDECRALSETEINRLRLDRDG